MKRILTLALILLLGTQLSAQADFTLEIQDYEDDIVRIIKDQNEVSYNTIPGNLKEYLDITFISTTVTHDTLTVSLETKAPPQFSDTTIYYIYYISENVSYLFSTHNGNHTVTRNQQYPIKDISFAISEGTSLKTRLLLTINSWVRQNKSYHSL